jgi:phenylalanyl-tRNA synthetase beta chain
MDKSVTCGDVEKTIKASSEYITDIKLFDIYEGAQLDKDKKSMAFSVVFTPRDEEFTTEFIEGEVGKILGALKDKYGVVLRT